MTRTCIACDGANFDAYCPGLIECKQCNLVVAEDIPTDQELSKLYQEDYFFGKEYSDYKADRPALERNFRQRIKNLDQMLKPTARVVEVGCAYGYFLGLIKDRVAWHQGYDVSEEGIQYARSEIGANASTDNFLDVNLPAAGIDSIFMWDVVEHLPRPEEFIAKSSELLKPGGRLALTTGDISAFVPRIRKEKWRMIHPPTHIYYFTPGSMTALLEKNGFKVERVSYPSVSRNVGSVFNQLIINQKAAGSSGRLLEIAHGIARATRLDKINLPLNTWDIMEVVAVKQ